MTLPEPDRIYKAKVLRVIDGDTFEVLVDVGFHIEAHMPLRLAHVDAPEHNTADGKAAIKYVTDLIGSLPAAVVVHTFKPADKFGRYLADVLLDDYEGGVLNLGQNMVEEGFAVPYEGGKKA